LENNRTKILLEIKRHTTSGLAQAGAVARPKVCADLEVLRPSERQCKPRLRQAAGTLHASGESTADNEVKNRTLNKILTVQQGHKK